MKRILLIPVLAFSLSYAYADTIPSGDVYGTWTAAGSPYHVMGNITIPPDEVLKIEPGVVIKFHGNYGLRVNQANLIALGTQEDSIIFTSADTNGFVNGADTVGGWKGIFFYLGSSGSDSSRLQHCRLEFAKSAYPDGWLIKIDRHPRLVISNCEFINNRPSNTILDFYVSDPIIKYNRFTRNQVNTISLFINSNPVFSHNHIDSNNCEVALSIGSWSGGKYDHNMFYRNQANKLIYVNGNCKPRIFLNKIFNNQLIAGGALLKLYQSKTHFINNLILNNDGMGFELWEDQAKIVNNTIINNFGNPGEYIVKTHSTENLFLGNLFQGNSQVIYCTDSDVNSAYHYNIFDSDSSVWFEGTDFQGAYENNIINWYVSFVEPTAGAGTSFDAYNTDYNVAPGPGITNNGDPDFPDEYLTNDMFDSERIRYGRIDIGAYETNIQQDTLQSTIASDEVFFADTIHVFQDVTIPDNIQLTFSARAVILFHGPYSITVEGSLLATGTEDEPILFTLEDTAGFTSGGYDTTGWNGILLDNTSGNMDDNRPSKFEHCIFEYGKNSLYYGGVFTIHHYDSLFLSDCEFRYNKAESTSSVIFSSYSDFNIEQCIFHHNQAVGGYGAILLGNSTNRITGSVFFDNEGNTRTLLSTSDGSLDLLSCHFYNNRVLNWSGTCVLYASGSDIRITNCLFNNNEAYDARMLDLYSSAARIKNSTFSNNRCHSYVSLTRTDMDIYNSIFWDNFNYNNYPAALLLLEENSDPNLYNTIIQEDTEAIRTITGASYTGQMLQCLDTDPFFISPSKDAGYLPGSDSADWNLLDVSPGIDAGTADTSGLSLPLKDLSGQVRIFNNRVDIGAFEKAGNSPVISQEPVGGNFCSGDSIILSASYVNTDSAFIQWKKDGTPVEGEDSLLYLIMPANQDHSGNYTCELSNSFGTIQTPTVFLNVKDPPEIIVQPEGGWMQSSKDQSINLMANGTHPLSYQWYKDGASLPGEDLPELNLMPVDSAQEGTYYCIVSNSCGTDSSESVMIYIAPQLCMVTVSETSGHNLIIWEKKSKAPIMAYNVYRESSAAGIYDRLVTIPYDDLSVFVDTMADPTVQAYLYKITAIDTAGNETDADLCKPHKTIHLLVSTNPELNTTQLEWDRYYGFEYASYFILRSVDGSVFSQVHDMSSNLHSWTDPNPVEGELVYRIAVERPDPCYPTDGSKKAGTGPYNHSLSNLDDNRLQAGQLPPDTITLSNQSIQEENLPATVIGKLITEDKDSIDSHSYQFVPGMGDDDNISFTLLGDLLLASESFDYETKSQYTIRIRSTDQAGNYYEITFTILIVDIDETTGLPVMGAGVVKVYPNPFSHSTTISFPNPAGKSYRMVLTDLSGKVYRIVDDITASEYVLEKGSLKKGFYFIELRGSRTFRGKIVVE